MPKIFKPLVAEKYKAHVFDTEDPLSCFKKLGIGIYQRAQFDILRKKLGIFEWSSTPFYQRVVLVLTYKAANMTDENREAADAVNKYRREMNKTVEDLAWDLQCLKWHYDSFAHPKPDLLNLSDEALEEFTEDIFEGDHALLNLIEVTNGSIKALKVEGLWAVKKKENVKAKLEKKDEEIEGDKE